MDLELTDNKFTDWSSIVLSTSFCEVWLCYSERTLGIRKWLVKTTVNVFF